MTTTEGRDPGRNYPQAAAEIDRIEPAPRRVRGTVGGRTVFDTTAALYVWEWPYYPQYYIPVDDIEESFLVDEHHVETLQRRSVGRFGLRVGDSERRASVQIFPPDSDLAAFARIEWDALDAWYEEDEQIFVHPRNPYVRVDAVRSRRHVRVELEGALLAESTALVLVFETGLPTRYYFDRTDVAWEHLVATDTETRCPYKGTTATYWSVQLDGGPRAEHRDLAWTYDFPTRELLPIAGLVAFYNEKVDIAVEGRRVPRPRTHFVR